MAGPLIDASSCQVVHVLTGKIGKNPDWLNSPWDVNLEDSAEACGLLVRCLTPYATEGTYGSA